MSLYSLIRETLLPRKPVHCHTAVNNTAVHPWQRETHLHPEYQEFHLFTCTHNACDTHTHIHTLEKLN